MSHIHPQQTFAHHQSPQRWGSPIRSTTNTSGAYSPSDARQRLNFGDRTDASVAGGLRNPATPRTMYQGTSAQQPSFSRASFIPQSPPTSQLGQESPYPANRPQSSINQSMNMGTVQSPTALLPNIEPNSIEYASKKTDEMMEKDTQHPSLYQSLISDHTLATGNRPVSGLLSHDYPPVIEKGLLAQNLFSIAHKTPVPAELNELLGQPDVGVCHMGLFPEIFRAWMTIDSDLYLWDFRDGTDLSFYDGLKESIITMALVSVKNGVFQSPIRNLLVITTVSEVVILGFVVTQSAANQSQVMELVPQPIFVLSTEGNVYTVIQGTSQGRILLGSTEGFIHEIQYQAGRGWLSDRCYKLNLTGPSWMQSFMSFRLFTSSPSSDAILQIVIDNHRNIVFTRSSSGAIQAFDMGNGSEFKKLGYISYEGIVNSVLSVSRKTLESTFTKKILCIAPIEHGELNLVAVTDSGTRLYFSCYNPPSQILKYPNLKPTVFNLVHIRLPPGYCTTTSMKKPAIAQNAFYSNGIFSLSSHVNQEQDCLWLITPFMYQSVCFSEVSSIHTLPGVALDMKAIPCSDFPNNVSSYVPDIVTQHLQWQREIVILTPHGTLVYRALKPYELLKDLLTERLGPDHIKGHYELGVSRDQPLSNTVLLAIHPYYRLDNHVHDSAMKAIFMYGNSNNNQYQPQSNNQQFDPMRTGVHDATMDFNPNIVSTPTRDTNRQLNTPQDVHGYPSPPVAGHSTYGLHFQQPAATPQQQLYQQQQQPLMYQQQQDVNWNFSPRHDAMYLVVSRILAPIWNRPLVKTEKVEGSSSHTILVSNISPEEIAYAITFLQSMQKFITNNPSLYMISTRHNSISMVTMNANRTSPATPQEVEKNAIAALKNFLSLILEVFGMWKILCDHQFHIVLHGMEKHLENATMKEMVVTQHNVVSLIINALILKYLGDNAAVDAISLRLREVCPTLFRSEDAIGSKVAEMLAKVKNMSDQHEKETMLKESLNLCEQICGHGRVNFRKFCQDYAELGYPSGFVRLCVTAAKAADPDQLAVAPLKSGAPSSDPAVEQAFQSRAEIYNIAFEILDNYTKMSTMKQSPLAKNTEETMPSAVAQKYADETIQAILNCEDEVFHIGLYNWLVERKLFDRLLQIKHPYLDSFVQVTADAVMTGKWSTGGLPTDTGILDLLWRHHEKNQNHMAAAQILSKLSESTTTGLNLQQRLEYISRAIICAKSCYRRGDLLEQLEDKGDVARIQKFVLDLIIAKLNSFSSPADAENMSAEYKAYQDAIPKLNQQLYNITTLYTDFVEPFKLYEAKLDVFFSSGHGDRSVIEAVWSDIVEAELNSNLCQTMESQMEIIRRKLVSLGRKYITSPVFFPLEYLVEHLEDMKPVDDEHVGWVVKTMLEIGVPFPDLLTIYDKLWQKLTKSQQSGGAEVQIAKVIMFMIQMFTKEDTDIRLTSMYRPEMLEKCKNLTAAMIVEFSSRFDTTATQMTHQLNRVKEGLDRCRF